MIAPLAEAWPRIAPSAFIADGAVVIGDVEIGTDASIWYGCVLRGDVGPLRVGAATNVQEGTILHCAPDQGPTVLGSRVTVGHGAILHGCVIGDRSLVGMRATVLDGVVVGEECIIAAGALVAPGTVVPPRTLVIGSPAKFSRRLIDDDVEWILDHARHYVDSKQQYLKEGHGQAIPPSARWEEA
ncbi:MAG: gamma carbonic anhydrase family protein [Acidobacteriota bacterium]|jgi:carbonic anhydrase/acetyltransferase-like protein (isoleucine patch superfamily)